ncbi:MAG: phosphopantetheine-binding protein [Candidatus Gastranaerophilaceae bacterium]|nr:phosphopantetheine-binding protein [Candidatus Gastranaerophilaceae bacterium]
MELELRIKQLIINSLELEDIEAEDIADEEPLFGDGLGLDSIDALELGMTLKKEFNLTISKNKEENKQHFYSVKTIANFVRMQHNG